MNKIEIEAIKEYCSTISDLHIEINHGFEKGRYWTFFFSDINSWSLYVSDRQEDVHKNILSMTFDTSSHSPEFAKKHHIYEPTPGNFEIAIAKLQGYLKEMQEDEVLDRVRTYR